MEESPKSPSVVNITYNVSADVPRYADGSPTGSILSGSDVCRLLRVTRQALTQYERQGQLKPARVGRSGRRMYRIETVMEFVKLREELA